MFTEQWSAHREARRKGKGESRALLQQGAAVARNTSLLSFPLGSPFPLATPDSSSTRLPSVFGAATSISDVSAVMVRRDGGRRGEVL